MEIAVYNRKGEKAGTMDIPAEIFAVKWNPDLVHQAELTELGNKRTAVAHTKDRSEVRGGGKKPWRQKHTGRARHGSSRSPIWVGGGVTFGPRNEKNYSRKINKKMKRVALYSLLSRKLKSDFVKVVDALEFEAPKTKHVAAFFTSFFRERPSVLLVPSLTNGSVRLSARNIPEAKVSSPKTLNVYDCLAQKYVLFEKKALQEFVAHAMKEKTE